MKISHAILFVTAVAVLPGCDSGGRTTRTAPSSGPGVRASTPALSPDESMDIEQRFRLHYDSHYNASGYAYNQYRPAYRYGFDLAGDSRSRGKDWPAVEQIARAGWNDGTMGEWDRYKDAVRYGWEVRQSRGPGR